MPRCHAPANGIMCCCHAGVPYAAEAYLKAPNADISRKFGSVSISGDTIVVGAEEERGSLTNITNGATGPAASDFSAFPGAAYVFVRSGADWAA